MSDRLIIILLIIGAIVSMAITAWVYGDPRCIIAECRIVK